MCMWCVIVLLSIFLSRVVLCEVVCYGVEGLMSVLSVLVVMVVCLSVYVVLCCGRRFVGGIVLYMLIAFC